MKPKLIDILENGGLSLIDFSNDEKTYGVNGYHLNDNLEIDELYLNGVELKDLSFFDDCHNELKSLIKLDLANNDIEDISSLKDAISLVELNVSNNKLIDSSPLSNLSQLERLDISHNKINNIENIQNLVNLTRLNLSYCSLSDISKLSQFNHLGDLSLAGNYIVNPTSIISLEKLTVLNLNSCNLDDVAFLADCKNLSRLNLDGNAIKDATPLIYLNNLTRLYISNNQIEELPLWNSNKLYSIEANRNLITNIEGLKNSSGLFTLSLNDNPLRDISPLSNLNGLVILYIDSIAAEDFTPIGNLINLTDLSIEGNSISDISFLKTLERLEVIWLNDNNVKDISIISELRKISTLDLRNNPIKQLPKWISELNIRIEWEDDISRDQITFFNNPIETPSIDVIKRGNDAIKRYFDKIDKFGVDYIYEAKLTLVGEGAAGKTSLQTRLLDSKAPLPARDTRTRGIKIFDWKFKNDKTKNCIAHIWDFGGQDVYYPVHRFFLTENSVFVLVASTRQTHHNFDYWIPTIYQFGGVSPIILIQTCHDGNRISWNDIGNFIGDPNFNVVKTQQLPYLELNLPRRNEGLIKVKQAIINQIVNLPHYGKGVPKSWIEVRTFLSKKVKNNPCISFEIFRNYCVDINRDGFLNLIDVEDCAKFLHSIGVVLWYHNHEQLRDWIVLQPEWVMNAVYKIIDDEKIQKRTGNIISGDFSRLWKERFYEGKQGVLKNLLEVFKIAFPKKHKKNEYIMPARLLSMPIEAKWSNVDLYLRISYKYQFMPKGMVNQLSAELSRFIASDEYVWNNAVIFSNESHTAECQVEEDFFNRTINLKAKGRDARSLIVMIMNGLKDITEEYKGVKAEIYVPCTCSSCINSSRPTTFLYDNLIRWSTKKVNPLVFCNESGENLLIDDLLFNVGLANPLNETKAKKMNKTLKLFLASSSELSEDRTQFEIFINRENKRLTRYGIFIELNLWEDFIDSMSKTRLQDEYNKSIIESDIIVLLFFTKAGKYTVEEFKTAWTNYKTLGKPMIYTYFKNAAINTRDIRDSNFQSIKSFEDDLKALGHFPTIYNDINELKYLFKMQLENITDQILNT